MADFVAGSVYVLGFVFALAVAVVVICLAAIQFNECVVWPWRAYCEGVGYQMAHDRLMRESWWFSEDEATMTLLRELARDGYDIGQVRDRWRLARNKEHANG